jgi:excisionase family DNA binding protein
MKPGPPAKNRPLMISISVEPLGLPVPLAAIYLGVTEWYLEELLRSGSVEYRLLGNQRVVEKSALDQWFSKQPTRRGKLGAPDCLKPKEGQDSTKKTMEKESEW